MYLKMRFSSCMNILMLLLMYFGLSRSKSLLNKLKRSAIFPTYNGLREIPRYTVENDNEHESVEDLIKRFFVTNSSFSPTPSSIENNLQTKTLGPKAILTQESTKENTTTSYYATQVDNYPDFSVIAPKLKKFQGFVLKDSIQIGIDTNTLIEPDAYQYRPLCKTEIEIIAPRAIRNRDNRQVRVVNYPEYEQSIRAETCRNKNMACSYSESFPNNLMPICKQNYIFRQVLVMTDSDDPDVILDDIPIPSCCVCVLKDLTLV